MRTHEDLSFNLDREEQNVVIDGKKYVLIELTGAERDSYLNNVGNRLKTGVDGKPAGIKDFNGMQAFLVSLSLKCLETGNPVPVKINEIQQWPARVVKELFNKAKKLSALDEDGEEKNE